MASACLPDVGGRSRPAGAVPRRLACRQMASLQMECLFCRIVAGDEPAAMVLDEPAVVAFLDHAPVTTGHLLVVPRRHAVGLADLDPGDGRAMFAAAQRLAAAVRRSEIPCQGVNLFLADGRVAFQTVFHAHLHVLPRTAGDGFGLRIDSRHPAGAAALEEMAAAVRAAL